VAMPVEYASFLIRLWRYAGADSTASLTNWCSEVEHIQSGQSWTFRTLDELLDFVRQRVEKPEVSGQSARD
jgi:hypothetical protein